MTNRMIDDYMTVKEAAWRWGVELRTLRERLNAKRRPAVLEEIEKGLLKYFKAPDAKYGDWIISKKAMEKWYGPEPEKNKKIKFYVYNTSNMMYNKSNNRGTQKKILKNKEEWKMKLDYQNAYEVVEEALEDDLTWYLAVAFTQKNDSDIVKSIVAEQYQQASEDEKDFDMTVGQYLFAMLDEEGVYMKEDNYFESEEEAERQGFYWFDGIHRWLKLDVWK